MRVCVLGSTNIDLTFRVATLPGPGETVAASTLDTGFGGKGANQAVFAARLGAEVSFLSAVGSDEFGQQALANLRANGIDVRGVRYCDQPTGTAAILVDDSATNCIVVVAGANGTISLADIHTHRDLITGAQVLVAQLETPIEATLGAFRLARAAGVRTILNPAPAQPLPDELLALTDVCVPNETELAALTGLHPDENAARELRRRGPDVVIVTLGEKGALVQRESGILVAAPRVQAIDPTAAGDAFIGALAVFLAQGREMIEAVSRANRLAAFTVTRAGAQRSFPTLDEVRELLAE